MGPRPLFRWLALLSLCLDVTACGSTHGAQPTLLVVTPKPRPITPTQPASTISCRLPPYSAKPRSHLIFTGPCAFTELAPVRCVARTDDFYVYIHHKLAGGAELNITINIEAYSRPDTYTELTQVYMQISQGLNIYSWGLQTATATVGPGQRTLTLQPANLAPWPGTLAMGTESVSGMVTCR